MNPPPSLGLWWRRCVRRCQVSLLLTGLLLAALIGMPTLALGGTAERCDAGSPDDACPDGCQQRPEFWVINTRCAPRCQNLDEGFQKIRFRRYAPSCRHFVTESRASFLASETTIPTLFYVHGNYLDHPGAMKSFWQVYHKLCCCPGPKRLVCWSWPAQRVYRGLRIRKMILDNLRIKVVYAEHQGYYLASLIQQMNPAQRLMLTGHSYGAIVVSTAAHWLGGGQLRGLTLAGGEPVERPNLRIGLISGAFDNDALLPGHRYGQALVAVNKILITRNPCDSTLKIWRKISYRGCLAIGVTGLNHHCLGQYREKLCQITMTSDVGRSHYLEPHLNSRRLMSKLCCLAFSSCPIGAPVVAATNPPPSAGEAVKRGDPLAVHLP